MSFSYLSILSRQVVCFQRCPTIYHICGRYLYTPAALGVDSYLQVRERIKMQFGEMGNRFRAKMREFVAPNSVNMVFTEDLKHMVHLADGTEEDLQLIEEMMLKFMNQNRDLRFGNFIFGPVVMRMYYHLNKPKEALKVFLNPEMSGFFDQVISFQLLMDLLFNNEMYDEVMQVADVVKEKQLSGSRFPRNVVVLAMAAAYKKNTPDSLQYMKDLWAVLQEAGHEPMRRAITFAAALAINQQAPHIALELLSEVPKQNYVTIRNLKVSALADVNSEGLQPEALLLRATMYLLRGQLSLALEDLNTIIESQVQNKKITVNALIKRASLHLQSNEREKTFEDFELAESLDPNNPDLYLHRGQVNLLTDNIEQSIADFKKCVSLDPDFAIAVVQGHYAEYRRAVQEGSMSGIAKSIEKFKRDIRKYPKCTESYTLLAQILMDQQQFDEADKYFESAIKVDPSNATFLVHRGLLQLQWKGNIDTAIEMINEGIKVDDRCAFCYETLGTIEVQRGNLNHAVELFNKAIPLSKTEMELSHVFSLRDAAEAQQVVAERLGLIGLIGTT